MLLYDQLGVASCCGQWACSWAGVPHRQVDSLDNGAIVGAAPLQHCHPEVVCFVALRARGLSGAGVSMAWYPWHLCSGASAQALSLLIGCELSGSAP